MTSPAENTRARLEEISERLARCTADRWSHEFSDDGEAIVVTRAVIDRNGKRAGDEAPEPLLRFSDGAAWHEKELLREARDDLAFVLDQLTEAGQMIRRLRETLRRIAPGTGISGDPEEARARTANLAAEAAMKCAETGFQTYLGLHHATDDDGDLGDTANAANVLRRALRIESRKHLNTDPDAAERWRAMRAEYLEWVRR